MGTFYTGAQIENVSLAVASVSLVAPTRYRRRVEGRIARRCPKKWDAGGPASLRTIERIGRDRRSLAVRLFPGPLPGVLSPSLIAGFCLW